jgi:predicted TPR repeat methyltransferase
MNRKQRRAQGKAIQPGASGSAAVPDPFALHEAGIKAYRAGDLDRAAALISQAISFNGGVSTFHYNLGVVLKALGRPEGAAASYECAIALKPDYVDAHNNLGNVWKAMGRPDRAKASFERALQFNPGNADTHYNLGVLCCDLGLRREAEENFRRCLACDPDDSRGAGILLAHIGASASPERTSPAQLLSIYDVRSRFWDQERTYLGARLVADGLRRHTVSKRLNILDIGCGTGLVGVAVRELADRLDGIDISPAMLEKARAKRVYDQLFQADLQTFLAGREMSYDAVLAAATLIHFGDLKPLFDASARCLRGDGLFVFTLFPYEAESSDVAGEVGYAVAAQDRLAQSGCFRHKPSYVERLAALAGFSVLELKTTIHEHDQDGNPVSAILAVLRVTK